MKPSKRSCSNWARRSGAPRDEVGLEAQRQPAEPGAVEIGEQGVVAGLAPTLRLDYRNFSGKDIELVVLTGWIKVKDSPYQLDSVSHSAQLELSRKALLGRDVQATQALKLRANAIGFDRIELSQVTYSDGSSWKPQRKCVYANAGSTERATAR